MHPRFTVCGGCHIDRQLRFESPPLLGRTAPAIQSERVGGVATNIAVQLAALNAGTRLVSVQPPQSHDAMKARLAEAGVDPFLLPLAGEPPSYTALLGPDGELLTGAAAMALYDSVSAGLLAPALAADADAVIWDANFPQAVITAALGAMPPDRRLFAVGTSTAKVERLAAVLPRFDALVVNRDEAACLVTAGDVAEMASGLAAMAGGATVLVSDGGDVAALATADAVVTARPPAVELVNANGAGDVMAARLFYDLVKDGAMAAQDRLERALAAGAAYAAGRDAV